ncbi:hypothetical protein ACFLQW_02740 [Candidatus Zixiibacteriota bacterium]
MNDAPRPEENWDELRAALAKWGVLINILGPFLLLGVAYILRATEIFPETPKLDESSFQILLYALGAVALGELAVAFYLKKTMLRPPRFMETKHSFGKFFTRCVESMTLVFAVGAAPAVYGFVLYALGGTIEQFIFFILISLIGYRFVRPGKDELEKLWDKIGATDIP